MTLQSVFKGCIQFQRSFSFMIRDKVTGKWISSDRFKTQKHFLNSPPKKKKKKTLQIDFFKHFYFHKTKWVFLNMSFHFPSVHLTISPFLKRGRENNLHIFCLISTKIKLKEMTRALQKNEHIKQAVNYITWVIKIKTRRFTYSSSHARALSFLPCATNRWRVWMTWSDGGMSGKRKKRRQEEKTHGEELKLTRETRLLISTWVNSSYPYKQRLWNTFCSRTYTKPFK